MLKKPLSVKIVTSVMNAKQKLNFIFICTLDDK